MQKGILSYCRSIFLWKRKDPRDMVFIKGMMLFNLFFFLRNFEVFPYFFIVLQAIVALCFVRLISIKGLFWLTFYPKVVSLALLLWTLYILRNGFNSLHIFSHTLFLNYNYVCLLMPFILIPFAKLENLNKYIKFTVKTVKLTTILIVVLFHFMATRWVPGEDSSGTSMQIFEVINLYLNGGLMFLIVMYKLVEQKERRWLIASFFISVFCAAYFARRGVLLSYLVSLCFMALISLKTNSVQKKIKYFFIYSLLLVLFILFFISFQDSLFSVLVGRISDDTRSGVELEVLEQVLSTGDIYSGRGIAGTYTSILVGSGYELERDGVETGYLHLILKGGIIYLAIMALLMIPPILLGLFKSKNMYMKMLACFCLIFVIFFNVANSNISFSIRYFLFLICMWILYNPKYRKMSNNDIIKFLSHGEGIYYVK